MAGTMIVRISRAEVRLLAKTLSLISMPSSPYGELTDKSPHTKHWSSCSNVFGTVTGPAAFLTQPLFCLDGC